MKQENSREVILQSALELFAEQGYDAVSVNHIAKKAGITKPTLYYFFNSKEGLFQALLQIYYPQFHAAIETACCYSPNPADYHNDVKPVLQTIASAYFAFAQSNPCFFKLSLALAFAPPASCAGLMAEPYRNTLQGILEDFFQEVSAVHPTFSGGEPAAGRFMALLNSQVAFWFSGEANLDKSEVESLVKMFMHGVFG